MNNVAEHAREQKAGMKCPQCGAFITRVRDKKSI